jgi:hypothetical protein
MGWICLGVPDKYCWKNNLAYNAQCMNMLILGINASADNLFSKVSVDPPADLYNKISND